MNNNIAFIPSIVRYDTKLKANEKLLYGEITTLCKDKDYCIGNNKYFSELYNVDKNTISIRKPIFINIKFTNSSSDMNVYEAYYIGKFKPILNSSLNHNDNLNINLDDIPFLYENYIEIPNNYR